jgi:SNF2 family DNA or RNA helicase
MDNLLIREYGKLKCQELNANPYSCLDSEKIDINPHQIEAFVFALSAIRTGGAILADEVGLGKTIEAGLVLKYILKKGHNKILLIMPASLRKQWQIELEEKFSIDAVIVDSQNLDAYYDFTKEKQGVVITSYNFAAKRREIFSKTSWDFMVFDEAHRLRNIYKNSSKTANMIYELSKGVPKLMLTATPMQNTLLDMFGLVQFIDDRIFFDKRVFSQKYIKNQDYTELKVMLEPVLQRTLRSEVADYLQFKSRIGMTVDFSLTPMEGVLYKLVNDYLKRRKYCMPFPLQTAA